MKTLILRRCPLALLQTLYIIKPSGQTLPVEVTAGSRATDIRKLRQARKGAAVADLDVCRGGAWLSLVPAILMASQKVCPAALPWFCRTSTYTCLLSP